jgi:hypothetical protein
MDASNPLTDWIRGWFERSPKARRAYERLSADLDMVVERLESATSGLRERIAPIIDPPREPAPASAPDPAAEPGLTRDEQAAQEAEETTSESGPGATGQAGPGQAEPGR